MSALRLEPTMTGGRILPVWETIGGTYRFVVRHRWRLAFMGLPLFAIAIVLTLPTEPFVIEEGEQPLVEPLSWLAVMLLILRWQLIFMTAAVFGLVAAHRLVLLDDRGPFGILPFRLGKREVRFLAILLIAAAPGTLYAAGSSSLLLHNIVSVLGLAGDADSGGVLIFWGVLLGSLFASWLTLRLSLGLPATALDARHPFRTGWRLGRDNDWRLIAVVIIAPAPAVLGSLGIEFTDSVLVPWESVTAAGGDIMMYESRPATWAYIKWIGEVDALWAVAILETVMLSLSYRALGGMDGAEPPATTET